MLPAFDEEQSIRDMVLGVCAHLETTSIDYEVIVVNDGSQDRTGEILDELSAEEPRVQHRRHRTTRGYGAALRTGFRTATRSHIFYMGSHGQIRIEDLPRLLALAGDRHIVSGYRRDRRDSLVRRLNARMFGGLVVPMLVGVRVKDLNCGFKLIPRLVIDTIELESTGAWRSTVEPYGAALASGRLR